MLTGFDAAWLKDWIISNVAGLGLALGLVAMETAGAGLEGTNVGSNMPRSPKGVGFAVIAAGEEDI